MVDSVHPRGHEQLVENPLDAYRETHVAVMEERAELECDFIDGISREGRPDDEDLDRPEARGERDLDEMEAKGGGDVEIRVDVVRHVEAPKEGDAVVGDVQVVEAQ